MVGVRKFSLFLHVKQHSTVKGRCVTSSQVKSAKARCFPIYVFPTMTSHLKPGPEYKLVTAQLALVHSLHQQTYSKPCESTDIAYARWTDRVRFTDQYVWNTVCFLSTQQMMALFFLSSWKVQRHANLPQPLQILLLMPVFLRTQVPPLPLSLSLSVSLLWFCSVHSEISFITVVHHGQWASVDWGHGTAWSTLLLRYLDIKSINHELHTGQRTCTENIRFNVILMSSLTIVSWFNVILMACYVCSSPLLFFQVSGMLLNSYIT